MDVKVVSDSGALGQVGRKLRTPEHVHNVRMEPWNITPIMIAPVLPGDTLKNILLQARTVTDPLKNPLIGWWLEHYYFYCSFSCIDEFVSENKWSQLMLSTTADLTGSTYYSSTDTTWTMFNPAGSTSAYDIVKACMAPITRYYFRDDGETWSTQMGTYGPLAQIGKRRWMDSLQKDGTEDTPDPLDGPVPGEVIEATDPYYEMYQRMRMMRLVNSEVTYEDWLKDQGIRGAEIPTKQFVPELLRFVRSWQYPSNTVNPSDGSVASAVSWSTQERADKDRFFKEPGFIIGVAIARPKVYFSKQVLPAVNLLNDAFSWLPAALRARPETALKKLADTAGPLGIGTTGGNSYWVDVRDLFVYGDQFTNFSLSATDQGLVALPSTTTYDSRYVSATDIDNLFKTSGTRTVREDGVTKLAVLGSVVDVT